MSTRRALLRLAGVVPLAALAIPGVRAQPSEGRDILDKVEKLLWGSTVQGEYEMTIATPRHSGSARSACACQALSR